jgi:hypothetical protein
MMTRDTYQLIVTKLDQNAISLKEAKAYAARFGSKANGRTKQAFIKALAADVA